MKKNKKKEIYFWFSWLILVILWNYGFPKAKPLYDVLVAIFLSILFLIIKKKYRLIKIKKKYKLRI